MRKIVKFDADLYLRSVEREVKRLEILVNSRPLTDEESIKLKMFQEIFTMFNGIIADCFM